MHGVTQGPGPLDLLLGAGDGDRIEADEKAAERGDRRGMESFALDTPVFIYFIDDHVEPLY